MASSFVPTGAYICMSPSFYIGRGNHGNVTLSCCKQMIFSEATAQLLGERIYVSPRPFPGECLEPQDAQVKSSKADTILITATSIC